MKILFIIPLLLSSKMAICQDSLSIKDIPAAERVIGLQFTQPERDSLFDDVKNSAKEYNKMRQYPLPNNIPLSTWQTPVLPGMVFNTKQNKVNWNVTLSIWVGASYSE